MLPHLRLYMTANLIACMKYGHVKSSEPPCERELSCATLPFRLCKRERKFSISNMACARAIFDRILNTRWSSSHSSFSRKRDSSHTAGIVSACYEYPFDWTAYQPASQAKTLQTYAQARPQARTHPIGGVIQTASASLQDVSIPLLRATRLSRISDGHRNGGHCLYSGGRQIFCP